jgi:carbonic anhydrase/acetyltransferase-like protein (isoleucine patch superfamily)
LGYHIFLKAFHQPWAKLCNFAKDILMGTIHWMILNTIFFDSNHFSNHLADFKKGDMALIKSVNGTTPFFGKQVYLAENATIIGDVIMGDDCSVWFQAVIRGDVNSIRIGHRVNVQDGAIIHCTWQKASTTIGDNVSIGHRAIIHGCTLNNNILVGMGAIVMDHAVVENNVLIAAGAIVLENSVLESGFIYAGIPAKKVKPLSEEQFSQTVSRIANNYITYADWFRES